MKTPVFPPNCKFFGLDGEVAGNPPIFEIGDHTIIYFGGHDLTDGQARECNEYRQIIAAVACVYWQKYDEELVRTVNHTDQEAVDRCFREREIAGKQIDAWRTWGGLS